ncbi:beta barrel domain-containing protein [Acetobacter persici]|uniref:Uncharacterized protein n=1 Tax=Acetobacter persici TaxID=1076596 RepID=A0A1U9LJC3_9PROT|nr:hypothetical protein [Acetobacter persici]AQT06522.1 hypothetical protein A0U91_16065 [Acetobacter persici]
MEINMDFLRVLKKGDEVIIVESDYKGRKSAKKGHVVSRGSKWVTVATFKTSYQRKFSIETGVENVDSGYRDTLWESEEIWNAHKEREDAWDEFRAALFKHRSTSSAPKNLTTEKIRELIEITNQIFSGE